MRTKWYRDEDGDQFYPVNQWVYRLPQAKICDHCAKARALTDGGFRCLQDI